MKVGHPLFDEFSSDALDGLDLNVLYGLLEEKLDIRELLEELGFDGVFESGSNLYALCPYHAEKGASWGICYERGNPKWGRHGCFACHETGNVVSLVRDHVDGLRGYREAFLWLLKRCGLKPETEEDVLDLALVVRRKKGKKRKRKIGGPTWIKSLPLVRPGCDEWNYLRGRDVTFTQIAQNGLRVGKRKYKGRVIIPIYDHLQRLVSFYARDVTEDKERTKGLYPKGSGTLRGVLYGLHTSNPMERTAYIVEGIFDVWAVERSLSRVGMPFDNVFAALRSSLSVDQAELLAPWDTIVVVPDMKGKSEGLIPSIEERLSFKNLQVVIPDEGHDADSLSADRLDEIILEPNCIYESKVRVFVSYDLPKPR